MLRKTFISALAVATMLSGVTVVHAEENETPVETVVIEETTTTETPVVEETTEETPVVEESTEETPVVEEEPVMLAEEATEETPAPVKATGTQKAVVIGEEWGAAVTKTVLTLDKTISGSSVSAEDFAVIETKDGTVTERKVVNAYVSDANGNKMSGNWWRPANSNYVTVELEVSPSVGNPITWSMQTWTNSWPTSYELDVQLIEGATIETVASGDVAAETIATIEIEKSIAVSDHTAQIYPQLANVEMDTYTHENGTVVPYGFYTPEEDDHTNGIIVWNHGVGERGTDPKIAMYGNEVTALFGDEFQDAMEGCYVLVAQVPSNGSTNAKRATAIVDLVKALAAENTDIDLDRVYVAGCSMGGGMTCTIINNYADFFAAALPICPAGTIDMDVVGDLPVWFIHAENDTTVRISGTNNMMAAFAEAGKTYKSSIFPNVVGTYVNEDGTKAEYDGHWSWVYFFNNECVDDVTGENCFEWLAQQTNAEPVTAKGTQKAVLVGDDWGAATSKLVLNLDSKVVPGSVSAEDFAVEESKLWNGTPEVATRTVIDAYTSDENGNKVNTASNYVAIELYISPSEGGAFKYSRVNQWYASYDFEVTLTEGNTLKVNGTNATIVSLADVETTIDLAGNGKICPQLDGVKFYGSRSDDSGYPYTYETENGTIVEVPYAYYAPEADDHKNPIIIWNHGAGEGGDDPQIAVLANEVTNLWADEIQDIMDGAYVIAPQVPRTGTGRNADRADAIVQLVKDLAMKNPDIDLNRVYVHGCSAGGGMTLTLIKNHPDFFAAAMPICPAGSVNEEEAKLLVDLPMWFVHSEDDTTCKITNSTNAIANLEAAGNTEVHSSFFPHVYDTTGRFDDEEGNAYIYPGHWSWIYSHNNECFDENGVNMWEWVAQQTLADATGTQQVVVIGEEWGAALSKTIINFSETIDPASVDVTDFVVQENKDGNIVSRTVVAAYTSDSQGRKSKNASNYVTLELAYSPSEGNPLVWSMAAFANNFAKSHRILVDLAEDATLATEAGETIDAIMVAADIDIANEDAQIYPQLENVEINTYTDANGTVVPYGFYTPEEDGHKNGLIIWNHGMGEGGTDAKIAMYGNEVTALFGDEFQTIMDGCYVLVPQVPSGAGRNNDRADAIVNLVKQYAAANPDIDLTRVYVTGCSAGGGMTTTLVNRHADFFAAALPICAAGSIDVNAVGDLPIWYIHAENDGTVGVAGTLNGIENLKAAGKEVYSSIFPNVIGTYTYEDGTKAEYDGHWSWVYFFNNECFDDETGINCWEWIAQQSNADALGTQVVEVIGEEWGAGVTKTVIKLDHIIDGASVEAADFTVDEIKNGASFARTIVDAYISDAAGNKVEGTSNYVTIELGISPSEGNPLTWSFATWRNTFPESYKVIPQIVDGASILTSEGATIKSIFVTPEVDVADHETQLYPQLENVEIDTYTHENGTVIPYGFYTPAEDDHTNGIIVWNHGIGEGGTDAKIAMYGNEVTALFGEEFQEAMDGCYVLAAQVPNDGKRDVNRAQAIVDLVTEFAEANPDIDLDRVYVAGCSAGGGMTTTIINNFADFFAAALPICPAGGVDAEAVGDLPIWFIHAENDGTVSINGTYESMKALEEAGKSYKSSIFPNVVGQFVNPDGSHAEYDGHWSWVYFFNNECVDDETGENCFEWLAQQTNAEPVEDTPEGPSTQTGDNAAIAPFIALGGLSLAMLAFVAYRKKEELVK